MYIGKINEKTHTVKVSNLRNLKEKNRAFLAAKKAGCNISQEGNALIVSGSVYRLTDFKKPKTLTKKLKVETLKKCIKGLREGKYGYICQALSYEVDEVLGINTDFAEALTYFPEVLKLKPEGVGEGGGCWFNDNETLKRINLLKKVIKNL